MLTDCIMSIYIKKSDFLHINKQKINNPKKNKQCIRKVITHTHTHTHTHTNNMKVLILFQEKCKSKHWYILFPQIYFSLKNKYYLLIRDLLGFDICLKSI